jgi:broad specificity phosphatase PhoE
MPDLIHPDQIRHILVSPRQRAQKTATLVSTSLRKMKQSNRQLFGDNKPPKSSFVTDEEVGEWKYGAYEGMLTKDIRAKHPGWEIWRDG